MTQLKATIFLLLTLIFGIQTGLVSADEVTIEHDGFTENILYGETYLKLEITSNDPDFELPPEIFENREGYTDLRIVSGPNFVTLPSTVGLMRNVREFWWSDSRSFNIPVYQAEFEESDPAIVLPSEMSQMTQLQDITMWDVHVTDLPASFSELTNLREITLRNTYTTVFPQALAQIPSLELLILARGSITEVPDSIASSSLVNFQITGHQLERFPPFLLNQSDIDIIGLASNRISTIPDGIAGLETLKKLWLGDNQITHLPESIAELNLADLSMSLNPLEALPASYDRESNLCFLSIHDIDTLDLDRRTAGKFDNCRENIQNTGGASIISSSIFTETVVFPVLMTIVYVLGFWLIVGSSVVAYEAVRQQKQREQLA